jgi:Tfp pilus assembly major pilin PilA
MTDWVPLTSLFPPTANEGPLPPPMASAVVAPPFAGTPAGYVPESFAAQRSDALDATRGDSSFPEPPSLHWGLVWLFTMLTFGIFGLIWPFIQASWIRKIDPRSKATLLLGFAMGCLVIGYPLYFAGLAAMARGDGGLAGLGGLLLFAYWVLFLVAYFSMAGSMRDRLANRALPLDIGGVTLFFFTMYYMQAQLSWLARVQRTGQTSPPVSKGLFWAIMFIIPFVIGILAAVAIPSYQSYIIRSQVTQGLVVADGAKTAVADYYANHQALPADNSAAGLAQSTATTSKYVSSVDVADGTITVAFDTVGAATIIRQDVLVLTPSRDSAGALHWRCGGPETTVPQKYLPLACRQE